MCFLGEQPSVNLGGFEKVLETERDFFFFFFFKFSHRDNIYRSECSNMSFLIQIAQDLKKKAL